jgi:hypothetical protein
MNVSNKYAMIFHNEKNGKMYYSISDSTKQLDGTYANKSYGARFAKDTAPPTDRSKINFKGFTSNYQADKDSPVYATIQVMEWEYSEQQQTQYDTSNSLSDETVELVEKFKEKNKVEKEDPFFASSNIEIDDDDLPFI